MTSLCRLRYTYKQADNFSITQFQSPQQLPFHHTVPEIERDYRIETDFAIFQLLEKFNNIDEEADAEDIGSSAGC